MNDLEYMQGFGLNNPSYSPVTPNMFKSAPKSLYENPTTRNLSGADMFKALSGVTELMAYNQMLADYRNRLGDIDPSQVNYTTPGLAPQLATSAISEQMATLAPETEFSDKDARRNAAQWAKSGAQIGSVLGPLGTAVGAGLGWVGGNLFGGERRETKKAQAKMEELQRSRNQGLSAYNRGSETFYGNQLSQDYMNRLNATRQQNVFGIPSSNFSLI